MWPWDEVEVRRVLGIAEAATHGEFPQVHFGWRWLASSASLLGLHAFTIKVARFTVYMHVLVANHIRYQVKHITIHERKKRCR